MDNEENRKDWNSTLPWNSLEISKDIQLIAIITDKQKRAAKYDKKTEVFTS